MTRTLKLTWLVAISVLLPSAAASAQERPLNPQLQDEPLRVFLDCERQWCDFDHFRREVAFISYVRDRMDAQLHVLVTQQVTGAGGMEYTFHFIGLRDLVGREDTLVFASRPDDTDDETRSDLVQTFKLGLVHYVARTPVGRRIDIGYRGPGGQRAVEQVEDPWDLWVFSVRVSGELEGESREGAKAVDGSVSAGRTTEDLKLDFSARGEWEQDRFEFSDGEESTYSRRDYDVEGTAVWSLTPHWSFGASASASGSTRQNQDFAIQGGPALEYNIFPYVESTHRQITFLYRLELAYFDYEEITLYDKMSETRPVHSLEVGAAFERPWGELYTSLEWANFLDDFSQHHLELNGGFDIRIFRGLSLDVGGSVSRIKDQIYEPREDIPDEDILLRLRELGTDYRYSIDIGFNYTFGSVYNNVVNPRMSSHRRGRWH